MANGAFQHDFCGDLRAHFLLGKCVFKAQMRQKISGPTRPRRPEPRRWGSSLALLDFEMSIFVFSEEVADLILESLLVIEIKPYMVDQSKL